MWYIKEAFSFFSKGDEERKGPRISQGKPFLKRGPSQHSQSSFRRRSIRLKKNEERLPTSGQTGVAATSSQAQTARERWKKQDSEQECECDNWAKDSFLIHASCRYTFTQCSRRFWLSFALEENVNFRMVFLNFTFFYSILDQNLLIYTVRIYR